MRFRHVSSKAARRFDCCSDFLAFALVLALSQPLSKLDSGVQLHTQANKNSRTRLRSVFGGVSCPNTARLGCIYSQNASLRGQSSSNHIALRSQALADEVARKGSY
jgi:hypothetical protein